MKTKSLEPIPLFNIGNSSRCDEIINYLLNTPKTNVSKVSEIDSYETALHILGENSKEYPSWFTKQDIAGDKLKTIIKASNFLDNNNQEWIPDFNDRSTPKYINWLEKPSTGSVLGFVNDDYFASDCPVWFYFKNKETAKIIYNKFSEIYNDYIFG